MTGETYVDWCRVYVERGLAAGVIPELDSDEWRALPLDDPRRVASVVITARRWIEYWQPAAIRRRTEDEIVANSFVAEREWREAAARVVKISTAPSWAKRQQQWAGAS